MVTIIAIGDGVRAFLLEHLLTAVFSLTLVEVAICTYITLSLKINSDKCVQDCLSDRFYRHSYHIRFAKLDDDPEISRIFQQRFPNEETVDNNDYITVLSREEFIRVVEVTCVNGMRTWKNLIGYYGIWVLNEEIYRALASGVLKDHDITHSQVVGPYDPKAYAIHLVEICEDLAWNAGAILLRDSMRYIRKILIENESIAVVSAWPSTKDGKRLVRHFRMKPSHRNIFRRKIHFLTRNEAVNSTCPTGDFHSEYTIGPF